MKKIVNEKKKDFVSFVVFMSNINRTKLTAVRNFQKENFYLFYGPGNLETSEEKKTIIETP